MVFSLIDIPEERVLGLNLVELFSDEDRQRITELIQTPREKPTAIGVDVPLNLNGHRVTLNVAPISIDVTDEEITRIVILNDVTEQNRAVEALKHRVEIEKVITSISTHFANLEGDEVEEGIARALQEIGKFADADHSFVYLFSDRGKETIKAYECFSHVSGVQIGHQSGGPAEALIRALEGENGFEHVHIPSVDDLPSDAPVDKNILQSNKIESLIAVPMIQRSSLAGCVGCASMSKEKGLAEDLIHLLNVVGEIFANALGHKRAEERQFLLTMAIEQAAEGITIMDVDGTIRYVNPAFERVTGYSREVVIGRTLRMILGAKGESGYRSVLDTLNRGEMWSGKISTRTKDHREAHIATTISPIRDASGGAISHVAVMRDVTHEMNMEAQLLQTQKMETIGTLAGGIAHDFSNILSVIIGNTEIVLQNELPERHSARHSLDQVLKASYRAKDLIKQILTFSREAEDQPKQVKITPVVEEIIELLQASFPDTIEIHKEFTAKSDTVLCDPSQIFQLMTNLAANAGHAIAEEGGILKVRISDMDLDQEGSSSYPNLDPGPYLMLSVSDTGPGIPPELMEHIFDPYFTTKARGEGTGMGLAIAYGIVQRCGGAITVKSDLGKGSTFNVLLPKYEGDAVEGLQMDTKAPLPTGNEHLLVISDKYEQVKMAKQMLSGWGYEVTTRTSSIEALELFRTNSGRFDLVITDMAMTNMTGDKLAKELLCIRPEIPIILCTGFNDLMTEKKAGRLGIRELVKKPLLAHEMAWKVRQALDA